MLDFGNDRGHLNQADSWYEKMLIILNTEG